MKNPVTFLFLWLLLCQVTVAQNLNWQSLGPNNAAGRMHTLIINSSNPNHLLAAGSDTGLFESDNDGLTWTEHPQNYQNTNGQPAFETLAFTCGIQTPNGDIYLGTGDDAYASGWEGELTLLAGNGIYKSTNGGESFEVLPATQPNGEDWKQVYKIAIAPNGTIYACRNNGLAYSTDGGNTWTIPTDLPAFVCHDVAIGNDNIVHVLIGSNYYRSSNSGNNFTALGGNNTGQLPLTLTQKKRIVISDTNPNKLYAALVKTNTCLLGIYQSVDGGDTWTIIGEGNNPIFEPYNDGELCIGSWSSAIAIDPNNDNRLFLGGATLWTWTPSDNWQQIDNITDKTQSNYLQRYKNLLVFKPDNPNILYIATDGGIFRTQNANSNTPAFEAINSGLHTLSAYSIAANQQGAMLTGTFINGSFYATTPNNLSNAQQIQNGTSGRVAISSIKPNIIFTTTPHGEIRRSVNYAASFISALDENTDCQPIIGTSCGGDGCLDGGAYFIMPLHLWEDFSKYQATQEIDATLATGSSNGKIWFCKNPLVLTDSPAWRNIGTVTGGVSDVSFSKDGSYLWAASQTGRLRRITNLTAAVPTQSEVITVAASRHITSVNTGATPNEIIVTLNGYEHDSYVYYSNNGISSTPTFISIQHNLPLMPVYDAVQLSFDPDKIVAATEKGIWIYSKNAETWAPQNTNLGIVPVTDITETNYIEGECSTLYITTLGRGTYASVIYNLEACNSIFNALTTQQNPTNVPRISIQPNPINSNSVANIYLPKPTSAILNVYDTLGRLVSSTPLHVSTSGWQQVQLNIAHLPKGIYFACLVSNQDNQVQSFIIP